MFQNRIHKDLHRVCSSGSGKGFGLWIPDPQQWNWQTKFVFQPFLGVFKYFLRNPYDVNFKENFTSVWSHGLIRIRILTDFWLQCCGSMMFISDPGSQIRIRIKGFKYLIFIPDPDFFSIQDPGFRGQKCTGSRIRNTSWPHKSGSGRTPTRIRNIHSAAWPTVLWTDNLHWALGLRAYNRAFKARLISRSNPDPDPDWMRIQLGQSILGRARTRRADPDTPNLSPKTEKFRSFSWSLDVLVEF